jgi:hypothetical protein
MKFYGNKSPLKYCIFKILPLVPNLRQLKPVHILRSYFNHFNIMLPNANEAVVAPMVGYG